MKSQLIDTHTHLNFKSFQKDLEEVIARALDNQVQKIILVGANLDSSKKALEIASKHQGVFAAVGIHPHHADDYPDLDDLERKLEELIRSSSKIVALGETGIDFHQYQGRPPVNLQKTLEKQAPLCRLHLKLAEKHSLPAIIHCREAWKHLWKTIGSCREESKKTPRGVFHCWSGTDKDLEKALSWNFFISFTGNVTYPENTWLHELAEKVPLANLLLETDSPFMAPTGKKGRRCEPADIKHTAQFLADLKKTPSGKLIDQTTMNAEKLFGL